MLNTRMTIVLPALILFTSVLARDGGSAYVPSDAERARWTMADMRSIAIALESYKQDHGEYPKAASLDDLHKAMERYIRVLPTHDAWGNAYRVVSGAGDGYQIVSPGSDHRFDEATWASSGEQPDYAADAVLATGLRFVRQWQYK